MIFEPFLRSALAVRRGSRYAVHTQFTHSGAAHTVPVDITNRVIERARAEASKDRKRREIADARAVGLVLNVGPQLAVWYWLCAKRSRRIRLRLGETSTWSVDEARLLATEAHRLVFDVGGVPDEGWVAARRRALGKEPPLAQTQEIRSALHWTFAEAREKYLLEIKRTRRPATHKDYAGKLWAPEIDAFARDPVSKIGVGAMSRALQAIGARGAYTQAAGVQRVIRAMWSWLESPAQSDLSGVTPDAMRRLRAPEPPIAHGKKLYLPDPCEIGRILTIARSGAIEDPALALAIQLLVYTAQRRITIATAERAAFVRRRQGAEDGLWRIPTERRKSGRRLPGEHVIPLPPSAWRVAVAAEALGYDRNSAYAFPGRLIGSDGQRRHLVADRLTHALGWMPGVKATPHDIRRALATHGERELGFPRALTAYILDHAGDRDVTGTHYALHDRTHTTWPVMDAWCAWVDAQAEAALEADTGLRDVDGLRAAIEEAERKQRGKIYDSN